MTVPQRFNVSTSVVAAVMVAVVGATTVLAGQPWLFPSLGPTAYLIAVYPELPTSRLYNCFVGHLVGLGSGFAAVAIFNAWNAPIVPLEDVTWPRMGAAAVAIGLTVFTNHLLRSGHPPAAATTLLVALGTFHTAWGAALVVIGVAILLVIGELLKLVMRVRRGSAKTPAP
ncbi:MAG TPA: HPP family protein [Thermoleophilia bacterium]|nr:HPP family protein [Thermoleophilia bacterium]